MISLKRTLLWCCVQQSSAPRRHVMHLPFFRVYVKVCDISGGCNGERVGVSVVDIAAVESHRAIPRNGGVTKGRSDSSHAPTRESASACRQPCHSPLLGP